MSFRHVRAGDIVMRLVRGRIRVPLRVTEVDGRLIHCGPWMFDRDSGAEVDYDRRWGPEYGITGSTLVDSEPSESKAERCSLDGPEGAGAPQAWNGRATWNQAICDVCWVTAHDDRVPVRIPQRLRVDELCCLCGRTTDNGIYIRADPQSVRFPRFAERTEDAE